MVGRFLIMRLLTTILTQMTTSYQGLQDRMQQNNQHLSMEVQQVINDNENFKKDVCVELDMALADHGIYGSSLPFIC